MAETKAKQIKPEWKWRGLPGHFIAVKDCIFRLCTDIGKYRISTVGGYYPDGQGEGKMQTIGCDRHYETYVFLLDPKSGEVSDLSEIDANGILLAKKENPYDADKRAEAMHMKMCEKYSKIATREIN